MENVENKAAGNRGGNDDQLAKDVARLYAWANVEGVPYRDFSRQRAAHQKPAPSPGEDQKVEIASPPGKGASAEDTSGTIFTPVTADAPAFAPAPLPAPEPAPSASALTAGASEIAQPAIPIHEVPAETIPPPLLASRPRPRPRFIERLEIDAGGDRPALAVFSLAGGVGKTTISANLARILCFQREEVLLVDASGSGLLPFYFGANDLRPGLRTFVAPGMKCSPLRVIGADEVTAAWLENDVSAAMSSSQRTIFDLGPASFSLLPQIFAMCTGILIPLLPDPNSILSISRIENLLEKLRSAGHKVPSPYYVFNQFDDEYSMDLQARELAGRQCGERLLPLAVRHGVEIAEAIAFRMTVADHAPESEVTHDFLELALWLENVSPISQSRSARRWTEQ